MQRFAELIRRAHRFYEEVLGYAPKDTDINLVPDEDWAVFAAARDLSPTSTGAYLPRSQTAAIRGNNPLSLFHEYYGHGLYGERTLPGRRLVSLEQALRAEEEKRFRGRELEVRDLRAFRQTNATWHKLQEWESRHTRSCELFAIWTEYILGERLGYLGDWEEKYGAADQNLRIPFEQVVRFSERFGLLATFYNWGLEKDRSPTRVRRLLRDIYGAVAVSGSKLVLLTGSRAPHSDIDLFASSNCLPCESNEIIDLVVLPEEEFERRLNLLDIQLIFPLLHGRFICGNRSYFEDRRKRALSQPITREAIAWNLSRSQEAASCATKGLDEAGRKISEGYALTYALHARRLSRGERDFDISQQLSKLKGGNLGDEIQKCWQSGWSSG